jgi:hypothetical protein
MVVDATKALIAKGLGGEWSHQFVMDLRTALTAKD